MKGTGSRVSNGDGNGWGSWDDIANNKAQIKFPSAKQQQQQQQREEANRVRIDDYSAGRWRPPIADHDDGDEEDDDDDDSDGDGHVGSRLANKVKSPFYVFVR
ncbi:hypothetical protein GQ42DRAFT_160054 [Ramicandelaber brevisporus]|nr:hypothetical protein GQ42DRAFT_160054 [Ramicandelaber brevisporus]